jgi:hypothetical protein
MKTSTVKITTMAWAIARSNWRSVSAHNTVAMMLSSTMITMSIRAPTARTGSWAIWTSSTTASPVTIDGELMLERY